MRASGGMTARRPQRSVAIQWTKKRVTQSHALFIKGRRCAPEHSIYWIATGTFADAGVMQKHPRNDVAAENAALCTDVAAGIRTKKNKQGLFALFADFNALYEFYCASAGASAGASAAASSATATSSTGAAGSALITSWTVTLNTTSLPANSG